MADKDRENVKLDLEIAELRRARAPLARLTKMAPLAASLVALVGIWIGFSELRADRERTFQAARMAEHSAYETRMKELQRDVWIKRLDAYFQAAESAAIIASRREDDASKEAYARFWTLYYGPLAIVEDQPVEEAMVSFGKCLSAGDICSDNVTRQRALTLANTMRASIRDTWQLSENLGLSAKIDVLTGTGTSEKLADLAAKVAKENQDVSSTSLNTAVFEAYDRKSLYTGRRILWVDDRPESNQYVVSILEELGASVDQVTNNKAAMTFLTTESFREGTAPDIVISDISRDASNESGLELVELLGELRDDRPALIFYVSTLQRPPPFGAIGITNRIDVLIALCTVALQSY